MNQPNRSQRLYTIVLGTVLGSAAVGGIRVQAQDTTLPSRTVNVTSTYKPVLQNASKINFTATLPQGDLKPPVLSYDIPAQNLYFSYLPAPLDPQTLRLDSGGIPENSNYVKAGFGNFTTPYAEAGFSFGDDNSALSLFASHLSSQGNIQYQDYGKTAVQLDGHTHYGSSILYGKAGFKVDDYELYGYDHKVDSTETKGNLQHNYQTFNAQLGIKNATSNEYGFSYDPHVNFSVFRDDRSANEINGLVQVPIERKFGDNWAFRVNVAADLTYYSTDSLTHAISNNVFYVTPVVAYHNENFTINAGINPSWDNNENGKFNLFPHFDFTVKLTDPLSIVGGWTGYYQKNNYQYLASINPYMEQPDSQYNSEIRDFWGGIKGSLGNHVSYLAKVSYIKDVDLPLFVNDYANEGKSFYTVEEYQLRYVQAHGELGFTAPGHFSLNLATDINNYYSIKTYQAPWGMTPFDFTAKLRWQPVKDVTFKADLFSWAGADYLTSTGTAGRLGGAFDLNGGVEFSISKAVGLWLDCNNILNDQYHRWNQYQVLGFNIVGGVVFSFGQSR